MSSIHLNMAMSRPQRWWRQRQRRRNAVAAMIAVLSWNCVSWGDTDKPVLPVVYSYQTAPAPRTPGHRRQWYPRPNYFLEGIQQKYSPSAPASNTPTTIPSNVLAKQERQVVTLARTVSSIAELTPVQQALEELRLDQAYAPSWQETTGAILAAAVVLGLAATSGDTMDVVESIAEEGVWDGFAKLTVENVIDATVPGDAVDVVTILLAESISGVIGAAVTLGLNLFLSQEQKVWSKFRRSGKDREAHERAKDMVNSKPIVGEAVASSEYFIAKSVSYPLIMTTGLPSFAATLGSTILASIPYQIAKSSLSQISRLKKEDQLMSELLRELKEKERREQEQSKSPWENIYKSTFRIPDQTVDPSSLVPVSANNFDFVSFFSDVTRWLEYDVLSSDFGGRIFWDGAAVDPSLCSAGFGFLAAASSQIYADCLYGVFNFGPQSKQKEVQERSVSQWVSTYLSTCLSAASLFGVFDFAQRPMGRFIQGTLAGGVDGCFGSDDFDLCLQTYINTNAPGASPEAQIRALMTNLSMVGQRMQDVYADAGSAQEVGAQLNAVVASAAVSAYSMLQHYIPIVSSSIEGYTF